MVDVHASERLAGPSLTGRRSVRAAFVFGSVAREKSDRTLGRDLAIVGSGVDLLALAARLSAP